MRVANPNKVASWSFQLIDPEGEEITIPSTGGMNNLQALKMAVLSHIQVYDNATGEEYSKEQKRLAEEAGKSFEQYIGQLIEHQMCLRFKNQIQCWNEGVGDSIHNALSAVDGYVAKTPEPIRRMVERAISVITPSKSVTFSGCSACGGTHVMNPRKNNLGRAGKLNNIQL